VPRRGAQVRDRALAATQGARTGREAWVRLANAGLLPAGWLRASARKFSGRGGSCHAPDTVADALRFAEDPAGMARAEQLARAMARTLGARGPATVIWKLKPGPLPRRGASPTVARRLEAIRALGYGVDAIYGGRTGESALIVMTAPRRS
jgi:hypothetical protein